MVDVPVESSREGQTRLAPRLIAVVPAYNEEPTVIEVLDRLSGLVHELVIVDDGSTDRTRELVQSWLPAHPHAELLTIDVNRGMSAAYYLAFSRIAARVRSGDLPADTLVCTVDADGQHDPHSLDGLVRVAVEEHADAVLARRDLSDYPPYKRIGNTLLSRWATWWAKAPLPDVESGYRVFRAAALADALRFYRGYRYSETVEVAVVLCRLGYTVRNDVLLRVPVFRSRTKLSDAVIDAVMIVVAARRAARGRARFGRRVGRPLAAAASTLSVAEHRGNAAEP
jgi:glycosyltransferase involved in cell wall biosynthesis